MADHNQVLQDAWLRYCDRIREAGQIVFADGVPDDPVVRAEGLRYLARHVAWGIDTAFDPATADAPALARALGPTRKMGGDNPDSLYAGAPIDGRGTYRVSGTLGSAHMVMFTVSRGRDAISRGLPGFVAHAEGRSLETDADGRFELILSGDEHPGNWLPITADSERLVIRQAAGDWGTESVGRMTIERLDRPSDPPQPLTPSRVADALERAADWLAMTERFCGYVIDGVHPPNTFYLDPQSANIQGAPGGEAFLCWYRLARSEALVVTVTPPHCWYWNVQIGNHWMESFDYRHRISSLNQAQVELDPDGSVEIIVAHSDPTVPNWLDTAGNVEGHLAWRWIGSDELPAPSARVVDLHDWMVSMSPDRTRVSRADRQAELATRRAAVDRRYVP